LTTKESIVSIVINPLRVNHEHVDFQKSSEFAKHGRVRIKKPI